MTVDAVRAPTLNADPAAGGTGPSLDRTAVVAVGGNALIRDGQRGTIAEQFANARATAKHIAGLVNAGWRVILTHGNGPQVGFILLRSELVSADAPVPRLSLDMAVADSVGGVGYIMANSLANELAAVGLPDRVVCVMTQTVVDPADPAFQHPTKPIGPAYSADEAERLIRKEGWAMVEDAGRGYRRVVPSPRPVRIVEVGAIRALVEAGYVVVACGGGGIPVVETAPGQYQGVEAVVDKDFASALLAASLGVETFVISTGVEQVAIRYRQPDQQQLAQMTVSEARMHLANGEFPEGSMGPKIRAAIDLVARGGKEVVITSPNRLEEAMAGQTGTRIVAD
ncbi:MAG: carbamate kinase [Chloroflexi bacterium]|nr:carbamate kinase [Chloroflexota bacterium]